MFKTSIGIVFAVALGVISTAASTQENGGKSSTTLDQRIKTGVESFLAGDEDVANTQTQTSHAKVAQILAQKLQLNIEAIGDSPVPGLLQLHSNKGLFYASEDGHYFLQARVYNIENGIVDETENAYKSIRLKGVEEFADSAITFKAEAEKYVINVFTDTTCGYCRKLHNEMAQLNDYGITVRYLAFPRAGLDSEVFQDTVSIWCATDPNDAMTRAKSEQSVADASCKNRVAEQYQFGRRIGISGTPNIVLPDGSMIPGYQPANALKQTLENLGD